MLDVKLQETGERERLKECPLLVFGSEFVRSSSWNLTGTSLANWMNLVGERHFLTLQCCSVALLCVFKMCSAWVNPWHHGMEKMCSEQELKKQCVQFIQDKGVEKVSLEDLWRVCLSIRCVNFQDRFWSLMTHVSVCIKIQQSCLGVHICSLCLQNFFVPEN